MLAVASPAGAEPPPPDYRPAPVGEDIREMEATAENLAEIPEDFEAAEAEAAAAAASAHECEVLDTKIFLALDNYNGLYFFAAFNLLAQSDNTQIWVQADLSWPAGDPRPTPEVTCEQSNYLMGEFDDRMYPIETDFFGAPDEHDGTNAILPGLVGLPSDYYADAQGRQVVLVSNVRDENYFDSNFPLYIAGFYSDALEGYFDRNTMTIDAYDWENRTGPDSARPFLYEGVFAHEYQHLLHSDYDGDEVSWVNEGLSDFAEFLVGYGHPDSHVEATAEYPENSLVVWEDQGGLEILSDYGHAYFYMLYLYEQFGSGVLQDLFLNTANDITGVNAALAGDTSMSFADVYHDYAVALLIDHKKAGGKWEFDNIDFNLDIGAPDSPNPEAYDTPGAPPWGTDYIWLDSQMDGYSWQDFLGFEFNGVPFTVNETAWTSDGEVLYSGAGNLIDNWAIFEATGGGILTFDTSYDIEALWDFGFVQVSTDGGHTWLSLANAYTTSDHADGAHPKVFENLPGLTGSLDWTTMSFDLSTYAGQDILLAFRYITDWAFVEPGWYVDNVYVDDTLISDGSSTDPFMDITEVVPIENDFEVTLVGIKRVGRGNAYKIMTLDLDDISEEGLTNIRKLLKGHTDVVLMVTYEADEGVTDYADYEFELIFKQDWPEK
jgi:hypothetical protein